MLRSAEEPLSIGALAERTGVPAGTLRMWEARHGFPRPERLPSGHRRYSPSDVEAIRTVVRERESGASLASAIRRAVSLAEAFSGSPFADLRRRRPELRPHRLEKWAMDAISRAIEDEYLVSGERGLLVGAFQRPAFYRAVEGRWRELSRLAEASVVLARFRAPRRPAGGPAEHPIGSRDPSSREWAVICDAPGFSACLVGVETAPERSRPDRSREFEVNWSFAPDVVRDAAESTVELVSGRDRGLGKRLRDALGHRAGASVSRGALSASERMVGYLYRAARDDPPR
jgi:DNA-binding transcriptional MerR regulator